VYVFDGDIVLDTDKESLEESVVRMKRFILEKVEI
jgi:hypothetical protein